MATDPGFFKLKLSYVHILLATYCANIPKGAPMTLAARRYNELYFVHMELKIGGIYISSSYP